MVRLFDCITGQGWLVDLCNRSLFIDGISNRLGSCRYKVLRHEGLKSVLLKAPCRFSLLATAFKLILICTLLFPLLMLVIKRRKLKERQFLIHHDKKRALPVAMIAAKRPTTIPKVDFMPIEARPAAIPNPLVQPQIQLPEMAAWPVAKAMEPVASQGEFSLIVEPPSLRAMAKAFTGIVEGWKKLEEEIGPISDIEIARGWSQYQSHVSDLLKQTPVEKTIDTYCALRRNYPRSSLFPSFTLEDSKGNRLAVDRFLAAHASPVLAAACRSGMKEAKVGTYASSFFDEGLLQPVVAYIQKMEEPRLNLKQLISFYKTCDHLQMDASEYCRRKLCQRLLFDRTLKFEELLDIWTVAEEHQDGSLRYCCLRHLSLSNIEYALPPSLNEFFALYQHLKPYVKQIAIGEQGKLSIIVSSLNREQIESYQRIGIEKLTVHSLFDAACAQGFQSITSLTLAIPHAKITSPLISSLIRPNSSLRTLKIGYGHLDDDAAHTLSRSLVHLNSLALMAVGVSQQGMQTLAAGLKTNQTLDFLQMSHGTLDETKWQLLTRGLQHNTTLKTLCISDNKLGPALINSAANFLTKILQ